jgi:hypothetical protein
MPRGLDYKFPQGLRPESFITLNAALKRRSSTVRDAFTVRHAFVSFPATVNERGCGKLHSCVERLPQLLQPHSFGLPNGTSGTRALPESRLRAEAAPFQGSVAYRSAEALRHPKAGLALTGLHPTSCKVREKQGTRGRAFRLGEQRPDQRQGQRQQQRQRQRTGAPVPHEQQQQQRQRTGVSVPHGRLSKSGGRGIQEAAGLSTFHRESTLILSHP